MTKRPNSRVNLDKAIMRLFAFRRLQTWPPRIVMRQEWESLYRTANAKGGAKRSLAEAIEWAHELIAQIASGGEQQGPH